MVQRLTPEMDPSMTDCIVVNTLEPFRTEVSAADTDIPEERIKLAYEGGGRYWYSVLIPC